MDILLLSALMLSLRKSAMSTNSPFFTLLTILAGMASLEGALSQWLLLAICLWFVQHLLSWVFYHCHNLLICGPSVSLSPLTLRAGVSVSHLTLCLSTPSLYTGVSLGPNLQIVNYHLEHHSRCVTVIPCPSIISINAHLLRHTHWLHLPTLVLSLSPPNYS